VFEQQNCHHDGAGCEYLCFKDIYLQDLKGFFDDLKLKIIKKLKIFKI
jgi:hypothetical protein